MTRLRPPVYALCLAALFCGPLALSDQPGPQRLIRRGGRPAAINPAPSRSPLFRPTPLNRLFDSPDAAGFGLYSVESDEPVSPTEESASGRRPLLWDGTIPRHSAGEAPSATDSPQTARPLFNILPQASGIRQTSGTEPEPNIVPAADAQPNPTGSVEATAGEEVKTAGLPVSIPGITLDTAIDSDTVRAWRDEAKTDNVPGEILEAIQRDYDKALEYLSAIQDSAEKTEWYRQHLQNVPDRLAGLHSALSEPLPSTDPPPTDASPGSIEQLLIDQQAQVIAAENAVSKWDEETVRRKERRPQMPSFVASTEAELKKVRSLADAPPVDVRHPHANRAAQTRQVLLARLLEQQLAEQRAEHDWYKGATDVFPLEQQLNRRNLQLQEERLRQLVSALAESRRRESLRQAAEARQSLQEAHPALKELAERNAELTRTRSEFQTFMKTVTNELAEVNAALKTVESDFENVKDKEERAGLTTAIGMLLRNHRKHSSIYDRFRRERAFAEEQIARLQTEQLALEDELDTMGDIAEQATTLREEIARAPNPTDIDLHAMATSLLQSKQTYLNDLLNDYESCLENLTELDVTSLTITNTVNAFRSHIDERVLWIRSSDAVSMGTVRHAVSGTRQLLVRDRWIEVSNCLRFEVSRYPGTAGLAAIAFLILLALRSRFVRFLYRTSETGSSSAAPSFPATAGALGLTLLIASVWPCIFWLIGWRLEFSAHASDFTASVGFAMRVTAAVFGSVEAFRQICRPRGVGECHLRWPTAATRGIHANLVGLLMFGLPLVFLFALADRFREGGYSDSLGRFVFIVGMPLIAFTLNRMINPNGAILRDVLQSNRGGWMYRSRHVWHMAVVGAPLLLAVVAFAGYQYTANALLIRLDVTIWLAILLLIGFSVAATAITQAQTELMRVHHAARLRRARAARRGESDATDAHNEADPEQSVRNIADMHNQIGRLSRAIACIVFLFGCWTIWSQVLPAFQALDRIELWPVTIEVTENVEVNGRMESQTVSRRMPITPARLMIAIASLAFAVVAGRNLPALLELSVLRRLPIDAGGRNAITTLCRYGITIAGVAMACKAVGIGWASVQWLVAALTVGLGFGLQEIFANFVSGLIILFERPIRIGDVLTIDGITGSVARIQIRATTIIDLDNKEYIVPNKEFVTGRVLNWTLSDESLRVVVSVGVAYGSDVDRCRELMLKVASDHPIVLSTPAPVASFEGFGASSLDLTLRCFIPSLHERVNVTSDLNAGINRAFAMAGIEIPFPQMDLNVKKPKKTPSVIPITDQTIRKAA